MKKSEALVDWRIKSACLFMSDSMLGSCRESFAIEKLCDQAMLT